MKKKIQLISKDEKNNLITVSKGYAFNYLIPKQKAEIPTKKQIKHIEMFQVIKQKKDKINEIQIQETKIKLKEIGKISMYKKIGDNKLIFGSVTEKEIINWIKENTNIDNSKIKVKVNNIKKVGIDNLTVRLKNNKTEEIQLNIIPVNI